MFYLRRPDVAEIERLLDTQRDLPFSYAPVGATREFARPAGFPINALREKLGTGAETFRRAAAAVRAWKMYDLGWTIVYPPAPPVETGAEYAVLVRHLGFWSLNPCRVVYAFDESGDECERAGFAVGTLPAHSEAGEERFTVEWNRASDEVFYDLFAYARAEDRLARLGAPFVKMLQKQFARESLEVLRANL